MNRITILNFENYMHLFTSKNNKFNNISWVEPIFIAMTRAYQNDEEIDLFIENDYFRNMIENKFQKEKTYTPIEKIISRQGLETISTHITSIMLKNFPKLKPLDLRDLRDYLQYLFLELMNNVADHSQSTVGGYVMAQYYTTNKKIQFAVADRGIAFLENMKLNFKEITNEEEAIFKALEKGATSTKAKMYGQERNAGYGLFAMFEILKITGGSFTIVSNDTLVRYNNNEFETKILKYPWKGVAVSFSFLESEINHNMDYFKKNYLWNEIINEEDEDFF